MKKEKMSLRVKRPVHRSFSEGGSNPIKMLILILIALGLCKFVFKDWSTTTPTETNGKPTVKIGATLPLTGELAFAGIPAQKAMEMALADLQKEQNLKYNYELVFEDDAMDKKRAILNLNRMESINKISAITTMWLMSSTISPFANDKKIIHMGCSWGKEPAKGLYNFNYSSFYEEQTALLIEEMQRRGVKKVGVISSNTLTDEEIVQYIKPELNKVGIETTFIVRVNPGTRDFKTEIAKMKQQPVDIVLLFMVSPENEIFAKQVKEQGYNVPLSTFDNFAYFPEFFEGQWFVRDAAENEEFTKRFEDVNSIRPESCSGHLYEGLKILVHGFEDAPTVEGKIPDNKDVAETILNAKSLKSVLGNVYMDSDGNIHTEPSLRQIKNGKIVPIEE